MKVNPEKELSKFTSYGCSLLLPFTPPQDLFLEFLIRIPFLQLFKRLL